MQFFNAELQHVIFLGGMMRSGEKGDDEELAYGAIVTGQCGPGAGTLVLSGFMPA